MHELQSRRYGKAANNPQHDASRSTAWAVISALEAHRPRYGVIENVPEFMDWNLFPAWRLALALQDAGWWLRQDIIWHKPNPMPESVRDRCTKAHEYLFLLTKSEKYFYDFDAMQEPVSGTAHARGSGVNPKATPSGWDTSPGGHRELKGRYSGTGVGFGRGYDKVAKPRVKQNASFSGSVNALVDTRNRRTVWTIPTQSFDGAHFATFPESLVEPCVLAGSRPGDIIFDPFMGSGTVASVAQRLGRRWLGAELNPDYIALQAERTRQPGLVLENAA